MKKILAIFSLLCVVALSSCSKKDELHPIIGTWDVESIYLNDQWISNGDNGVNFTISLSFSEEKTYQSVIEYYISLPDGGNMSATDGGATGTYEINGDEVILYFEGNEEVDRIDISKLDGDRIETAVDLTGDKIGIRAKKR